MIDLHTHSTASDGTLTPSALVSTADDLGLTAVALTDHDTVLGIAEAIDAAKDKKVIFIPGVEISAEIDRGSLHIIGLHVDHQSRKLQETLAWTIEARNNRNLELVKKLNELNMPVTIEEAASLAGGVVIGRPHFAELLVKKKYTRSFESAFRQYLGRGKPAHVPKQRLDKRRAIEVILSSGGVPILAHPDQTLREGPHLEALIKELVDFGLLGIETFYTGYKPAMSNHYVQLAKKYALVMSGGSDFHGDMKPDIRLGRGLGGLNVPDELLEPIERVRQVRQV
jgi:predicted metal-dependent phosphoesterase TrpH